MLFTKQGERVIDFLLKIDKKGFITRSMQKIDSIRYYMVIWHLRDNGLIITDGVDDRNQKKWVLTPKGKRVAEKLKGVREVMGEDNGEMQNSVS